MGQGRGYQHLGLGGPRTQANNLVQGLHSGIEFSREKLYDPGPEDPKPGQGIVRAGAHRLPQPIERFFAWDSLNFREGARREVPDLPLEGQRVSVMAGSEIRIERDGSAKKGLRGLVFLRSVFVEVPKSPLVGLPSIEPLRRLAQYSLLLGLGQRRLDDTRNTRRDLVLHGKDIA